MTKGKAKKGFTLIELIVVIALMSIVGLGIALIFTSANDSVVTLSRQTDINVRTNAVMDIVQTQLKYAKDLKIDNAGAVGADPGKRYLYSKDGKVYLKKGVNPAQDMFSEAYYEGYYIDITISKMETNIVSLEVSTAVKNDPSISFSLITDVNVLNTEHVEGESGNMVSYEWGETS